jgi:hypothetical protein
VKEIYGPTKNKMVRRGIRKDEIGKKEQARNLKEKLWE